MDFFEPLGIFLTLAGFDQTSTFLFMQFLPLCEIRPKAADAPIT